MGFKYHTTRQRRQIVLAFFFDEVDGARLPPFAPENEPFFGLRWTLPICRPSRLSREPFFAGVITSPLPRFLPVSGASNANRIAAGLTSSSESKSERTYSSGAGGELTVRVARLGPGVVAMLAA